MKTWKLFIKFGRVYAIYVPNRRNIAGDRFGFVRFLKVANEKNLERQLDQIQIGKHKLPVNIPMLGKRDSDFRQENKRMVSSLRTNKTYAEALKGTSKMGMMPETDVRKQQQQTKHPYTRTSETWKQKTQAMCGLGWNFLYQRKSMHDSRAAMLVLIDWWRLSQSFKRVSSWKGILHVQLSQWAGNLCC